MKVNDFIEVFRKYDVGDCDIEIGDGAIEIDIPIRVYEDADIKVYMYVRKNGDELTQSFLVDCAHKLWRITPETFEDIRRDHIYPEIITRVVELTHIYRSDIITHLEWYKKVDDLYFEYSNSMKGVTTCSSQK